jgi:hypothetical protein
MEELKQEFLIGVGDLDSAWRFSGGFPGFPLGIQVDGHFPLVAPSPRSPDTGPDGRVLRGLSIWVTGQDWDGRNQDIALKS